MPAVPVSQAFALALQHHRAGNLANAEALYRQILAAQPDHSEALHMLGAIAQQCGRHDLAREWMERAIVANPNNAAAHASLAEAYRAMGRLDQTIASYRRALELHADSPDALNNLGIALARSHRSDEAVASYQRALQLRPSFPEAHYNLGIALAELGRWDEAIACYVRALELRPGYAEAHFNLGVALAGKGLFEKATASYRRALELRPQFAEAHNNLGIVLAGQGRLDEAIGCYRRALEILPDNAETYYNLGNALASAGQVDGAIAAYRHAVELKHDFAQPYHNLGSTLAKRDRFDEAVVMFQRAIELKPDYAEAHGNLGNALRELGRLDEAVAACQRAIQLKPDYPEAHNHLGTALALQGRLDEAIAAFRRALAFKPDDAEVQNNLGNGLLEQGRIEEASAAFHRAIELQPASPEANNNLGNALREQGRSEEATAAYRRALDLNPLFGEAYNNLGTAYKDRGDLEAAIDAYRRALELRPNDAKVHDNIILALQYLPATEETALAAQRQCWNRRFSDPVKKFFRPFSNDRNPDRRLRIGYVSPDFRDHVVGRNLLPLFRNHDHRDFEILCYAGAVKSDGMTDEFRRLSDRWQSTPGVTDEQLVEIIREDGVDILVDLAQHTVGNRLPMFARRPAPVQVSFAGYPESAGVEAIEFRISDRWLEAEMGDRRSEIGSAPRPELRTPISDLQRAERVFLIDSFWCYDPCGLKVEINALPAKERGVVTFGSLNNFCKINEPVLKVWAGVLGQVKNSRLILLSGLGSHRERTLEFLEREGIDSRRVEFEAPRSRREYLELYHRLDVALDPLPYNGHTTSLDALWMGVPVVSVAGARPVSRAGLSQMSNLGLPELVAFSEDEYVRIAVELAHDLPRLAELRATLRSRMETSVLMDRPRFARQIENAFRSMWRQWCLEAKCP